MAALAVFSGAMPARLRRADSVPTAHGIGGLPLAVLSHDATPLNAVHPAMLSLLAFPLPKLPLCCPPAAVTTTLLGHGGLLVHQVPDLGMLQILQVGTGQCLGRVFSQSVLVLLQSAALRADAAAPRMLRSSDPFARTETPSPSPAPSPPLPLPPAPQFACVFQHVMLLPMWVFVVFRYFMLL